MLTMSISWSLALCTMSDFWSLYLLSFNIGGSFSDYDYSRMSLAVIVLLLSFIYLFVCFGTVVFDFTLGPLVSLNLRDLKT